ncbi:hypothetical protein Adt_22652 [Abeliophyllum distichum]|uniref:Uncharacterized protein n=1 Tax=Abeliophyllum distichum TaxID=126358 RepID=A0ABD1S8P8_9LAMI
MTCSECGQKGHNKRYHLRADAPTDGKLTPKRGSTSASNQEPQSIFKFIQTPGVDMRHADMNMLSGPLASSPLPERNNKENTDAPIIITKEVDVSTMVEELERLDSEKATSSRAERARARRQMNTSAIQFVYLTRTRAILRKRSFWNLKI